MKVIILPGNGCSSVMTSNWYGWLHNHLINECGIECIVRDMPDPLHARRSVWIPFIRDTLAADENSILVGHSSGAQAALRYTELYPVRGAILVSATYSDLNDPHERQSGYYPSGDNTNNLYDFASLRRNCLRWHQFHSTDDCFIPVEEAEQIRQGLGLMSPTQYTLFHDRSHFFDPPVHEIVDAIKSFI